MQKRGTLSHHRGQQYRPNPPRRVCEVLHLFQNEWPVQQSALAVGQPPLEDLVAAQFVVPDGVGDVLPVGAAVQIDVEGGITKSCRCVAEGREFGGISEALDGPALARHHSVAGAEMPPACGNREVVAGHVASVVGGGDGNGRQLRAQLADCYARRRRFRVQ